MEILKFIKQFKKRMAPNQNLYVNVVFCIEELLAIPLSENFLWNNWNVLSQLRPIISNHAHKTSAELVVCKILDKLEVLLVPNISSSKSKAIANICDTF